MNYLTNYYKNLCEKLQEKVEVLEMQLNEAGLKKALQTRDPELLAKEKAKASARRENYFELGVAAGKKSQIAQRNFGASSKEAGAHALEHEIRHEQARQMIQNINAIEDAEKKNLTPDVHDGPDPDMEASSDEVASSQAGKQMGDSGPLSHMFPGVMSSLEKLTNRKKQDKGMDEWAVQDGPQPH